MKLLNKIALGTVGAVMGVAATKTAVSFVKYRTEGKVAENETIIDRTEELNEKRDQLNKRIEKLGKVERGLSYVGIAGMAMLATAAVAMAVDSEETENIEVGDIVSDVNEIKHEIENESGNTIIGENIIIDQE